MAEPATPKNRREELQAILVDILGSGEVYFQPPESLKLEYPCIVYQRDKMDSKHANDKNYARSTRYQVTAIDPDPDGALHDAIFELPLCSHSRRFATDGLNHDIFDLYY